MERRHDAKLADTARPELKPGSGGGSWGAEVGMEGQSGAGAGAQPSVGSNDAPDGGNQSCR